MHACGPLRMIMRPCFVALWAAGASIGTICIFKVFSQKCGLPFFTKRFASSDWPGSSIYNVKRYMNNV